MFTANIVGSQPQTRLIEYTLVFENSKTKPERFKAKNRWEAFIEVKQLLGGVKGRMSINKFIDAGGKSIYIGPQQIFPPTHQSC
jgi:hypothetical protein